MLELVSILIKGGPVMVPLLLCSVISLAVTIERTIFWRRTRSKDLVHNMLRLVEQEEVDEAVQLGQQSHCPIARVLAAGLTHRNPSPSKAMEAAAQAVLPVLKKRLTILDTIITLAPLLGLLGTITGMISSFGITSEAGIGQPHAVTGGVAASPPKLLRFPESAYDCIRSPSPPHDCHWGLSVDRFSDRATPSKMESASNRNRGARIWRAIPPGQRHNTQVEERF